MVRKLASIQKIESVDPIPEADRIEVVSVLGWKVVVLKGKVKQGDLVCYIEVDSIVPDIPVFDFLRKHKFRVKTIRMKHTTSQGLVMTLDEVGLVDNIYEIGEDITEKLGITKYDEPVPLHLSGEVIGRRPTWVPKTDEFRLQSYPELLQEMGDKRAYVSVKIDGTSSSVYYNPILDEPFGVCSRNLNIKRDVNNGHWKVALRHDLENKMKLTVSQAGFVIQGELAGPGIQKNRMELKELELFVFDIFDIATHEYLSVHDMQQICAAFGLKTVDIIGYGGFQDMTVDDWIQYAEGDYSGTKNPREGIVIRACEPIRTATLDGHRLSFKVLNNQYLLKS